MSLIEYLKLHVTDEKKEYLIGNPPDEFDLDYRLIERKNTRPVWHEPPVQTE